MSWKNAQYWIKAWGQENAYQQKPVWVTSQVRDTGWGSKQLLLLEARGFHSKFYETYSQLRWLDGITTEHQICEVLIKLWLSSCFYLDRWLSVDRLTMLVYNQPPRVTQPQPSIASDARTYFIPAGSAPPGYLASDLQRVSHLNARRRLRSSSTSSLVVPRTVRSTIGDRTFPATAASVWNSLPKSVRSFLSLQVFHSRLKTELFARSYSHD